MRNRFQGKTPHCKPLAIVARKCFPLTGRYLKQNQIQCRRLQPPGREREKRRVGEFEREREREEGDVRKGRGGEERQRG